MIKKGVVYAFFNWIYNFTYVFDFLFLNISCKNLKDMIYFCKRGQQDIYWARKLPAVFNVFFA